MLGMMTALPQPVAAPQAQPSPGGAPRRGRIDGIDMARALAILGMVTVHFGPFEPDTSTLLGTGYRFAYGRASVLFVMLAGIGVTLLFRSRDHQQARIQILWRVIIFFPLGVALQALPTPVAVILQFYAMYYVLGALVAPLPTRVLAPLTLIWAIIGPTLYLTLQDPSLAGRGTATTLTDPGQVLTDLLLSGFYPLATWGASLLVGVLVGRTDLRDRATMVTLTVSGFVLGAAAYGGSEIARAVVTGSAASSPFLVAEGHTGAPLNVLGATSVAVAVLGLCLLLASAAPKLLWPLVAVGQMALTVYVGHLLVLAVAPTLLEARESVGEAAFKVTRFFLVVTVMCVSWRTKWPRGPLEALLALPFRRGARHTPMQTGLLVEQAGADKGRQQTWGDQQGTGRMPGRSSTEHPRPSPPWTPTSGSPGGTLPPND